MHILTKRGNLDNIITYEHICDTTEDMAFIEQKYITLGSTCVVLQGEGGGMEVYMADSNKEWHDIMVTGGNEATTAGLELHVCTAAEVQNGKPNIETPLESTLYLVPSGSESGNLYNEYVYVNGEWELFGGSSISLDGYATQDWVQQQGYLTSHQDISGKANKSEIPTKISELTNDSNFISEIADGSITENKLNSNLKTTVDAGATALNKIENLSIDGYEYKYENWDYSKYFKQNAYVTYANDVATIHSSSRTYVLYDIPLNGETHIKGSGFTSSTIKPIAFLDENDKVLVYAPTESLSSRVIDFDMEVPQGATHIYYGIRPADTQNYISFKTEAFTYNETITDTIINAPKLKLQADALNNMQIEGFTHMLTELDKTMVENSRVIRNGVKIQKNTASSWSYAKYDVTNLNKIYISGYANSAAGLYFILDENENIIDYYPNPSTNTPFTDIEAQVPLNASQIYVNGNTSNPPKVKVNSFNFKSEAGTNTLGQEISEGTWKLGKEEFTRQIQLNGSANGAFQYSNLQLNDTNWKPVTDDICPLNYAGLGYVGANHGVYFSYEITAEKHGLTKADIGKIYTADSNEWILIQVPNENSFKVGCLDSTAWWGLKTVATPPLTYNFGSEITGTAAGRSQIRPSIRNISVEIIQNTTDRFVVAESYDIPDFKSGLTAMQSNVGNNTNSSFVDLCTSIIATVRNTYSFEPNMSCTIYQNLKRFDDTIALSFYGGVQSGGFGSNDCAAVPMTSLDILHPSVQETYDRSTWDNSTIPPFLFVQTNNSIANATKMYVLGILMDSRNDNLTTSAGWTASSRKAYPYAIQPKLESTTYNMNCFCLPILANNMDSTIKFTGYSHVNDDYYFFAYNGEAASSCIQVPVELIGRKIEMVCARNASCISEIVSKGLDVIFTEEGYICLKLVPISSQESVAPIKKIMDTNPVITAAANTQYICGEVATLSFTPAASGVSDIIFESGTTATVLTVPSTVKFPEWFDPSDLEANKVYEISIMNGVYGAVMAW